MGVRQGQTVLVMRAFLQRAMRRGLLAEHVVSILGIARVVAAFILGLDVAAPFLVGAQLRSLLLESRSPVPGTGFPQT
jgi:hypothetical protein